MKGAIIACSVLFVLFLILLIRIHVSVKVKENLDVYLKVLFIKKRLFTTKKRAPLPEGVTPPEKKKKEKAPKEKKEKNEKTDILSLITLLKKIVIDIMKKIKRFLRIRVSDFDITIATEEAGKTAVLYGAVGGVADMIFGLFENAFDFKFTKDAKIGIRTDFLSDKTKADIDIDFSINIMQIFAIAFSALFIYIRNPIKKKKIQTEENEEKK